MRDEKKSIVIIGGGGHAKVVIDLILASERYAIAGVVDPALKAQNSVLNMRILGDDAMLEKLLKKGIHTAALGIGSHEDNSLRWRVYDNVVNLGFYFPALIHPRAYVSRFSKISEGVQVMANASVQPDVLIGEGSVINTGAIIEHDCKIGRNVFIGPNAVITGGVKVGDNTFIGTSASIVPNLAIGKNCLVAAGAVVAKNVSDGKKVKGVPAKIFTV